MVHTLEYFTGTLLMTLQNYLTLECQQPRWHVVENRPGTSFSLLRSRENLLMQGSICILRWLVNSGKKIEVPGCRGSRMALHTRKCINFYPRQLEYVTQHFVEGVYLEI